MYVPPYNLRLISCFVNYIPVNRIIFILPIKRYLLGQNLYENLLNTNTAPCGRVDENRKFTCCKHCLKQNQEIEKCFLSIFIFLRFLCIPYTLFLEVKR